MNKEKKTTKEKKVYTYFVYYNWYNEITRGSANCTHIRNKKIKNHSDFMEMFESIKKESDYNSIVIMNFILHE